MRRLIRVTAVLGLAACGARGERSEITETRRLEAPRPEQRVVADARMRLSPQQMDAGLSPHGGMEAPMGRAPTLAWDLPSGWKEAAAKPPVTAAFAVAGHDRIDASITVLPGSAGGMLPNLNRWRGQMGLQPMSDADAAALPHVKVLGVDAPLLQMDGSFKGAADSTMAAVAVERPGSMAFVKMVGPSADVRGQMDAFRAFCTSLRDAAGAEAAPAASSGDDVFDPNQVKWTAPDGWTLGPAKQMRLVTFEPKEHPGVECYIVVLGGTGGGLEANVNRWREQLSLAPLGHDAIAALPSIPVLGRPSTMVEIDGGAVGMLGLVCELGSCTLFVKMTGPMDALRAERARFEAFCKSLS